MNRLMFSQLDSVKLVKKAIDEYVQDNNLSCEIICEGRFAKIEKK